jgi:hypothetical protein
MPMPRARLLALSVGAVLENRCQRNAVLHWPRVVYYNYRSREFIPGYGDINDKDNTGSFTARVVADVPPSAYGVRRSQIIIASAFCCS